MYAGSFCCFLMFNCNKQT